MKINRENLTSPAALAIEAAVVFGFLAARAKLAKRNAKGKELFQPLPTAEDVGDGNQAYVRTSDNDFSELEFGLIRDEGRPLAVYAKKVLDGDGKEVLTIDGNGSDISREEAAQLLHGMSVLDKRTIAED